MRFLKNFKKVRRNVFTGSLVEEDLYNKFFEALESKSKIEEALKDIYQILENKNIEEMDKFESLTKSYFLTLSGGRPRSLPNIFTSITRNLIRMIKSKHIRNEFKESKKIFYIVLMSFSKYLPWDMISRYELVSLFAYLFTENNLNFILDDLKLRMTHSGTNAHTSYTETEEIENRFTFEGYLYFLKMKIYSLLHKKLTQDSLDDIRKRFKQLSRLSKNSLNNKYLIGQSRKLLDLVDLLFNMNPPSNLPDTDLYGMILENKNKIIDQCVDPLLECLCESLKYHCNPSYFKKYIQIIPRLAYQIKNYDPEENNFEGFDIPQPLGGYFLEKYLKILEKILVPPKVQLQLIDPSYFTINNLQISNYELLRNNKPYSFFSKLSDKDTHIIIKLCYKLDPIYTSFQVPIVVKLKEIDLFVILVDPGIKDNTQKSWFSFYKCDKKGSFTGNNERRILAIYYKKTEQNLVTSFDEDQELLLENDKYVCLKIDWYRKDKIRVSI